MTPHGLPIAATGVTHRFRKSEFLLDVDRVEIEAGEVFGLLGPSGSGKSTLLTILGLLEPPDTGTISLGGKAVTSNDRDARMKMAAVFQRPYLIKGSVGANVEYGLAAHGVPRSERGARAAAALERVGLAGWEDRSALSLSGGEAQRVSLARALVLEPRVLFLDEPLASLDRLLKVKLTREFASILRDAGVTVVYVTHDQDEAMVVCDRVAVMRAGRIVAQGTVAEVMDLPTDEWVASFLGAEAAIRGTVSRVTEGLAWIECCGIEVAAVVGAQVGDEVFFGIRPEDVLIFDGESELPSSSARNHLPATVVDIAPRGSTYHVVLQVGGARLASRVSRMSVDEMQLQVGSHVLAVFKATAVAVRPV
jgi:tungstate transport system ATP-binding protein